jgi:hypothetical protein
MALQERSCIHRVSKQMSGKASQRDELAELSLRGAVSARFTVARLRRAEATWPPAGRESA